MNELQNQQLSASASPPPAAQSPGLNDPVSVSNISARASASVLSQGDGLKAEYYDNIDFTNLKVTRTDPTVNFIWGAGSPSSSIGVDTFSARWTGQVEAKYSETYNFYTTSDDGVRLWVNGQQIINKFVDQSSTEYSGSIALVAGQKYDIKLEYFENAYSAVSQLAWSSSSQAKEIIPQSQLYSNVNTPANGNGLKAEYYDNIDFTNLKVTRTDATVNFNWGNASPDPSIGADTFSARWTGQVQAKYSETYNFYTTSDDGVRLWVNGQQIINKFVDQSPTENTGSIALVAGQKYDIKLEYFENAYSALSQLAWSSSSQTKEIIPQSQLYSSVSPNSDVTPPSATATAANLTTSSGNTYTFSVAYNDNTAINVNTIDSNDLLVTGPNGYSQVATLVSINNNSNGSPRTATYRINSVGESWNAASNGSYAIALRANQVSDTNGNFASAATIGNFQVNIASGSASGKGLKAEYYDNIDFTNLKVTRTDATVNFNWGDGSPDPSIGADTFSARWTGQVQAKYSETYNFYTTSDDGVRLWVNGQQIINKFVDQSPTENIGSIALVAGQKYDIRLEYFENAYSALSQLAWSSSSQTKEIIPESQLYSPELQATLTLGSSSTSVNEGVGTVNVTLLRTGDLSGTSTIKYATVAGTATAGVDYGTEGTESAGTIIFAPGESTRQVSILINDDALAEADETFNFVIDQAQGAGLGLQRTLEVKIQDNDRSSFDFTAPVVNEGNGSATVTVTRGNALGAASVDYTTVDGTAKAGSDYQAVSQTLNFAAGETSKNIVIGIINDNAGESNETFTLRFSNAVGVQLANQQATITILDNDSGEFSLDTVASGLTRPTAFDWTSDEKTMFIAQKNGVVRVLSNGALLATPFIDISTQVNDTRDRGLLGIAVHPDFGKSPNGNNYVYLLYTYDPPETNPNNPKNNPNSILDNPDQSGNRTARLVRFTANPNTNYTTAIAGSEVVLLGTNANWDNINRPDGNSTDVTQGFAPSGIINRDTGKRFTSLQDYLNNLDKVQNIQNFIANDSESHSVGAVRFGTDGSLFVSLGDGTSYNGIDPRAIRVQDLDSLSGKLLRIDAITGQGLSSNPFYNGDSNSNRSKVYNLGLRNPFRFTIDKTTNTPYIGDVGFTSYEEVNIGKPGANFGWPFYEGGLNAKGEIVSLQQPRYAPLDAAKDFYSSGKTVTAPAYTYRHTSSNSITLGDFYRGNTFPSIYDGALFVGDFSQGTIDALKFDSQGKLVSVNRFASTTDTPNLGVPVQITTGKDGNLYYANYTDGKINRFRAV